MVARDGTPDDGRVTNFNASRWSIAALSWAASAGNASPAQLQCNTGTLTGQYVFTGRGFIEPIEPGIQRMHYGFFRFDGAGKLSGKQSSSRGGKIGREQLEGTYTLNANCSGTMTFRFVDRPGTETHWDMYVTLDGKTGHIIRMDDGTMAVRSFQK
jgi:hypothetical protein